MSNAKMANAIKEALPRATQGTGSVGNMIYPYNSCDYYKVLPYSAVKDMMEPEQFHVDGEKVVVDVRGNYVISDYTESEWKDFLDANALCDLQDVVSNDNTEPNKIRTVGDIDILPTVKAANKAAFLPCPILKNHLFTYKSITGLPFEGKKTPSWDRYLTALEVLKIKLDNHPSGISYVSEKGHEWGYITGGSTSFIIHEASGYTKHTCITKYTDNKGNGIKATYTYRNPRSGLNITSVSASYSFDGVDIPHARYFQGYLTSVHPLPSSVDVHLDYTNHATYDTDVTQEELNESALLAACARLAVKAMRQDKEGANDTLPTYYTYPSIAIYNSDLALAVDGLISKTQEYIAALLSEEETRKLGEVSGLISALQAEDNIYNTQGVSELSKLYLQFVFNTESVKMSFKDAAGEYVYKPEAPTITSRGLDANFPDWREYTYVVLSKYRRIFKSDGYWLRSGPRNPIYILNWDKVRSLPPHKFNTLVLGFMSITGDPKEDKFDWESWDDWKEVVGVVAVAVVAILLAIPTGGASLTALQIAIVALTVISTVITVTGIITRDAELIELGVAIGLMTSVLGGVGSLATNGLKLSQVVTYAVQLAAMAIDTVRENELAELSAQVKRLSAKVDDVTELISFYEQESKVKDFIYGDADLKINRYNKDHLWITPFDKYLQK